jgi:hypothetical protein
MPRARLQTGPAQGQSYKSASEAARAMAMKRNAQSAPQVGATPQAYPQPSYAQTRNGAKPPQSSEATRRKPVRRRR